MCGIVGIIAKNPNGFFQPHLDLFSKLLVVDGVCRGMDSTGIFQVQKDNSAHIYKNSVDAMLFQNTKEWADVKQRAFSAGRFLIGHNRHATKGTVNPENAHPFHEESIILVHNGTLWDHKHLGEQDVDSHAVCSAFSKGEAKEVIPTIKGAFAFVWYDLVNEKLFAIRNTQRPLSIVETDDIYIIASESAMVEMLIKRSSAVINIRKITEIPPGMLHEWDLSGKLTTETMVKLHTAAAVSNSHYMDYYDNYGVGRQYKPKGTHVPKTTAVTTVKKTEPPFTPDTKVVKLFPEIGKHYKVGDLVSLKITNIRADTHLERFRWTGQVIEPGSPTVDAAGYITGTNPPFNDWYDNPIIGEISYISETNCGPTVNIRDTHMDICRKTWNDMSFGEHELNYVMDNEPCSQCSSILFDQDIEFSSIQRTGVGKDAKYKVTCPACIEDNITNEDLKNDYKIKRSALQASLGLSKALGPIPDTTAQPAGEKVIIH